MLLKKFENFSILCKNFAEAKSENFLKGIPVRKIFFQIFQRKMLLKNLFSIKRPEEFRVKFSGGKS